MSLSAPIPSDVTVIRGRAVVPCTKEVPPVVDFRSSLNPESCRQALPGIYAAPPPDLEEPGLTALRSQAW